LSRTAAEVGPSIIAPLTFLVVIVTAELLVVTLFTIFDSSNLTGVPAGLLTGEVTVNMTVFPLIAMVPASIPVLFYQPSPCHIIPARKCYFYCFYCTSSSCVKHYFISRSCRHNVV
jgi:hypothetical protein